MITRLAQGVLLVFAVSIVVFSMLYMMPGDPVEIITGERVSEMRKNEIRESLGLDKPLHIQYFNWLGKALRMDFGKSIITKLPVMQSLKNRIPLTLWISGTSMIVELLIAVPLGLFAAYKKDSIA
ncbi:MAG: ABC transporter permease, partial [Bacteroidales bacterium]|nr:ABC transporter permease [Bacteroidales bacterium]